MQLPIAILRNGSQYRKSTAQRKLFKTDNFNIRFIHEIVVDQTRQIEIEYVMPSTL